MSAPIPATRRRTCLISRHRKRRFLVAVETESFQGDRREEMRGGRSKSRLLSFEKESIKSSANLAATPSRAYEFSVGVAFWNFSLRQLLRRSEFPTNESANESNITRPRAFGFSVACYSACTLLLKLPRNRIPGKEEGGRYASGENVKEIWVSFALRPRIKLFRKCALIS